MTTPTSTPANTPLGDGFGYDSLPQLLGLMTGDEKHTAAATSTLDVVWTLYDRVLRIDPGSPEDPERDRFLLSKGHGPMAFYAVLAAKGFLDPATLSGFGRYDSPLGQHPDRTLIPGVEISAGSLGHGLPIGVGMAIGLGVRGSAARVFCLLGDGELDEASNHEAIAYAGRVGLDGLTTIVIDNNSASQGWPGGIGARFEVEGWSAVTADGRDHDSIERAVNTPHPGMPHAVVARVERKA